MLLDQEQLLFTLKKGRDIFNLFQLAFSSILSSDRHEINSFKCILIMPRSVVDATRRLSACRIKSVNRADDVSVHVCLHEHRQSRGMRLDCTIWSEKNIEKQMGGLTYIFYLTIYFMDEAGFHKK